MEGAGTRHDGVAGGVPQGQSALHPEMSSPGPAVPVRDIGHHGLAGGVPQGLSTLQPKMPSSSNFSTDNANKQDEKNRLFRVWDQDV